MCWVHCLNDTSQDRTDFLEAMLLCVLNGGKFLQQKKVKAEQRMLQGKNTCKWMDPRVKALLNSTLINTLLLDCVTVCILSQLLPYEADIKSFTYCPVSDPSKLDGSQVRVLRQPGGGAALQ